MGANRISMDRTADERGQQRPRACLRTADHAGDQAAGAHAAEQRRTGCRSARVRAGHRDHREDPRHDARAVHRDGEVNDPRQARLRRLAEHLLRGERAAERAHGDRTMLIRLSPKRDE